MKERENIGKKIKKRLVGEILDFEYKHKGN
jgi:hypothetical protein